MKTFFKKFIKNEKGFALIQAIGLAALAIVLLSTLYKSFNVGFDTWIGTIDGGMTSILEQSSLNGGSGGSGEPGGPGGEPIIPPEQSTGSYYFNAYSMSIYDEEPSTPFDGDGYLQGDYLYGYIPENNGWGVYLATADLGYALGLSTLLPDYEWIDKNQTSYDAILESINGKPIVSLFNTFDDCTSLEKAPVIPSSVTDMSYTFYNCTSLTKAPVIPNSVTNMDYTFENCTALEKAPVIPNSVTDMKETFGYCTNLTGNVEINASNLTYYDQCFYSTVKPITITGTTPFKAELAATANNGNVTY